MYKNLISSDLTTMGYTFSNKSKGGEPRAGAVATPFQLFLFFCSIIFSMWPFYSCFLSRGHKTAAPAIGSHSHSKYEEKDGRKGRKVPISHWGYDEAS